MNALRQRLIAEGRALRQWLRELSLWLLVVVMIGAALLAYRVPFSYRLDIGGSPPVASNCFADDIYDTPYISGFNHDSEYDVPRERPVCQQATIAYRWAFADANVRLPAIGRAPSAATLAIPFLPPRPAPVASLWLLDRSPLLAVPLDRPAVYHVLLPPHAADLDLQFTTLPVQPPNDQRELAFAVDLIHVRALAPAMPPVTQLGLLAAIVGMSYGLLRRWSVRAPLATLIGAGVILMLAALLAWQRLGVVTFTARAALLLAGSYLLTIALDPLARGLAKLVRIATTEREVQIIVALIVLAWLVRVLGLLHPQTYSSDVGLHANNLRQLTEGRVIFTEGLPGDAGGGRAPYPPGQYIAFQPLRLLSDDLSPLLQIANAFVDSLAILWLWLILRTLGQPPIAAYMAGLIYLFAAPLLQSLSAGELANVWGQSLVLPWVLVLIMWRRSQVSDLLFGATTALVLLGHFGVFLSMLVFAFALALIWLIRRDPRLWRYLLLGGGALLGVALLYYTDPSLLAEVLTRSEAEPLHTTAASRLTREAAKLTSFNSLIGPMLALLGLSGLAVVWRRCAAFRDVLLAWWLSVLLSWVTLLFSEQALRWEGFVYPAIALGGGIGLAALWRRDLIGRYAATAIVAIVLVANSVWWIERLVTYR